MKKEIYYKACIDLKKIFQCTIILFITCINFSYAQLPSDSLPDADTTLLNFYILKARYEAYYAELANEIGAENLYEEGTEYNNFRFWVNQWEPLVYPHGDMNIVLAPRDSIIKWRTAAESHSEINGLRSTVFDWNEIGPYDTPVEGVTVPNPVDRGVGTGRVQFITFDPQLNDSENHTVFTGSAKGGLYYSEDNGDTWYNGGTDRLPIIGVSYLQVDPGNSARWYISTGDGDGNTNSILESWNLSNGIYRTTDAGANWTQIGDQTELNASSDWQIKKILVNPNDGNILYAATSSGIYKTSNATASNPTWSNITPGGDYSSFYDIEFKADASGGGKICNPCTTLYVTESKVYADDPTPDVDIYQSTNSGSSWTALPAITSLGDNVERIAIEVTKDNPNIFYAVLTGDGYSAKLYKYTISTQTWTDKGFIPASVHPSRAQSVGVSPNDEDLIFTGDVRIKKSVNGGTSWTNPTSGTYHDDQHSIKFSPDGNTIWAATDGGVWISTDVGESWTDKNNGIGTATIFGFGGSEADEDLILTGMFDNGTNLYDASLAPANEWRHAIFGDGYEGQLIDYIDPDNMYSKINGQKLYRSTDGGQSFALIDNCGGSISERAQLVFNVVDPQTIYYKGWNICRTTDGGDNINTISDFSSFSPNFQNWQVFTVPSNQDFLYADVCDYGAGTNEHRIFKSEDVNGATPTWVEITGQLTDQYITDLAVDYLDPKIFYVTYGGVGVGEEKICKYNGNTSTWTDMTVNIPDEVSIKTIVLEKGSNSGIYLGSNFGIVYTNNQLIENAPGVMWYHIDDDLPYVDITNLEINYKKNTLRASTMGRGLWESTRLYCPDYTDRTYSGTQTTGFYEASNNISSSATIATSNAVTYRAGNEIALTNGFGVASGAEFSAFIHPCESGTNSFKTSNESQSPTYETIENENWESEILVYPNPNKGQFTFSLGETESDIEALLFIRDLAGREISKMTLNKSKTILDLTTNKAGIYFLEVNFQDGRIERIKVIKE